MNLSNLEQVIDHSSITVSPETSLIDVISIMSQSSGLHCGEQISCSCVLVMDRSKLVGIFTERDVVKLTASETRLSELKISETMTQPVIAMTLSDSATPLSALELFRQHRIRHLPVLDDRGQLVGIITLNNIHQMVLLQLQTAHDRLESPVEQRTIDLTQANARLQQEIGDRKQATEELEQISTALSHTVEGISGHVLDLLDWN